MCAVPILLDVNGVSDVLTVSMLLGTIVKVPGSVIGVTYLFGLAACHSADSRSTLVWWSQLYK